MPHRPVAERLRDILEAIERVEAYAKGIYEDLRTLHVVGKIAG